jgi:hypothetical protein
MTHRSLLIAILAAAGVLAAAQPAVAGKDVRDVRTTDPAPGGRASWIETRVAGHFSLRACDLQKDGHGVVAYASFIKGGRQNRIADLDGANGRCKRRIVSISLNNFNRPVYVMVCLHKTGKQFCRTKVGRS